MPPGLIKSLSSKLGKYYIRKGTEYCFRCPKCNDHKYRMEVNTKIGFFCFHCGWKGSISDLEFEMTGEYPLLRDRSIERRLGVFEPKECPLPKGFASQILSGPVLEFFNKRNLPWSEETETWGRCSRNPRMMNRLVIPIRENGKVVCWVARATIDGQEPKELSPPSSVSNKSHYVYNLDNVEKGDKIVIVEGIFDCERLKSYGYRCVSIMGSHISNIQVGKILSKEPRKICIMFDGDEAGRRGAVASWDQLAGRTDYFHIHKVFTPEGHDPDELTKEEVRGLLGW